MAIRRVNTAIVNDYRFVCGEDYVRIEDLEGNERAHMTPQEFHEVVEWFITEGDPSLTRPVAPVLKTEITSPKASVSKAHEEVVTYDPGDRKAVQTVSVGGPPLPNGESAEQVDLGKLAKIQGQPNVIHVRRP